MTRLVTLGIWVTSSLSVSACLDRKLGTVGQVADAPLTELDATTPKDTPTPPPDVTTGDTADVTTPDTPTDGSLPKDTIAQPGCPPMTAEPTVLVQEDYWELQPKHIAARDGVVYFGATLGSPQDPDYKPDGRVFRVSAGGGPYEMLASDHTYVSRELAINNRHLAYYQAQVNSTGPGAWTFGSPGIVLRDLETGQEQLVGGAPQGWEAIRDFELLPDSRVVTVFSSSPYPDGNAGTVIVYSPEDDSYVGTTVGDFRWMTGHGQKVAAFMYDEGQGTTMGGEAASPLLPMDTDAAFSCCRLMAADDRGVYQRRDNTIERLPWSGDPPVTLATDVSVEWLYARHENHLYWVQHDEVWGLNTNDGQSTLIAKTQTGYIDALAADRCGVYFSANTYPRLMAMAAPAL